MAIISIPTSVAGISIPGQLGKFAQGPLASLFGGDGKNVSVHSYPSDLAKDATKLHYVQFLIKEVVPAGYNTENAPLIDGQSIGLPGIGKLISSGAQNLEEGINSITDKFGISNDKVKSIVSNVTENIGQKGVGGFIGELLTKGVKISPQTTQPKAYISLYMPDTLTAQYNASYDQLSLTSDIGAIASTLRTVDSAIQKVQSNPGSPIASQPEAIDVASKIGSAFGIGGSENIGKLLLKGEGYAINPQMQMIFRGVDMRTFSLSFTFTPKSKKESDEVDAIINMFKFHYAPRLEAGKSSSNDSMFLVQPSIFNVLFKINSKENKYLPRYGDCVLTSIDVNYAPNGWASYKDGAPVQTQLNLQFQEVEVMDRGKLEQGSKSADKGLR
jgi:hypothetical protein